MAKILPGRFSSRPSPSEQARIERGMLAFYRKNPLRRRRIEELERQVQEEERGAKRSLLEPAEE